jgi:hypothetical protein
MLAAQASRSSTQASRRSHETKRDTSRPEQSQIPRLWRGGRANSAAAGRGGGPQDVPRQRFPSLAWISRLISAAT